MNWVAPENIVVRTIDGEVEFPKLPPLEEYLQAFTEKSFPREQLLQPWNSLIRSKLTVRAMMRLIEMKDGTKLGQQQYRTQTAGGREEKLKTVLSSSSSVPKNKWPSRLLIEQF